MDKSADGNANLSPTRFLIHALPQPALLLDKRGILLAANGWISQYLTRPAEELIGIPIRDLIPPSLLPKWEARFARLDSPCDERLVFTERLGEKDYEVSLHPLYDAAGQWNEVAVLGCEVTAAGHTEAAHLKSTEAEKQKLLKQLHHSQKLEAVGTLAGGIAHDFNNILMGLQGHVSLMLYDLKQDHPHRAKLENMESYIKRGADLTRQLLGFARGGKYDVQPTNLNELLGKSAQLFSRTRKELFVFRDFAADLWTVNIDQGQMDQVFLNLFINASQAMPGGGNLELRTENCLLDDRETKPMDLGSGRYVKITVTDDGVGMDPKTLERIFEPFFTTKPKGNSSGLGLASAYGIIKNHGGGIQVFSEPAKGTRFQIYLPATERQPIIEKRRVEKILTGHETILVVDDEQINIAVMVEMLEMLHYRVLPVGSGQEAVAVYREKGHEIDLVILDLVMPGISGGRTFEILREINPEVDVILASGYSPESGARTIINRGCRGFIQKPFQLQELSQKIRGVLDRRPERACA